MKIKEWFKNNKNGLIRIGLSCIITILFLCMIISCTKGVKAEIVPITDYYYMSDKYVLDTFVYALDRPTTMTTNATYWVTDQDGNEIQFTTNNGTYVFYIGFMWLGGPPQQMNIIFADSPDPEEYEYFIQLTYNTYNLVNAYMTNVYYNGIGITEVSKIMYAITTSGFTKYRQLETSYKNDVGTRCFNSYFSVLITTDPSIDRDEIFNEGQQSVLNNPNQFNLYTGSQYIAYGRDQYNRGASAPQFEELITSILDAPVKMIFGTDSNTGLLNFEILGVNLAGFFKALLTICLIIAIIKLVI